MTRDLRPPCDTGTHGVSQIVKRNFFFQQINEEWALGPRADEAHVAVQHVDELRQFIQAQLAQYSSYASDSRINILSPDRTTLRFGIDKHGTEFTDFEEFSIQTNAGLPIQD